MVQPVRSRRAGPRIVDLGFRLARRRRAHAWALKTLEDADALRNHLVWLLELADTIADDAAAQAVADDRRRRRRLHRRRDRGRDHGALSQRAALLQTARTRRACTSCSSRRGRCCSRACRRRWASTRAAFWRGAASRCSRATASRRADERGLTLQSGRRIESETIIWSAGVKPSPTIAKLALPQTKRGAIDDDARHERRRLRRTFGRSAIAPRFPTVKAASIR